MFNNKIAVGALAAASLFLAACSSDDDVAADGAEGTSGDAARTPAVTTATTAADVSETRNAEARLAISYDGGVMVLDAGDLDAGDEPEVLAELPAEGYLRLNPAGDGRHVFVSTDEGFRALDMGSYSKPHGDHSHHYAGDPLFTGFGVDAAKPGHVVAGDDTAVLFDDETGDVTTVRLTGMDAVDHFRVPAHHGIAVLGEDGTYMVTIADDEGNRTGVAQVDADGKELKRFEECPGAHGAEESSAGIFVGCSDGGLVYADGKVTKVKAPDEYGRIGNQAGSAESKYVLGDYKSDAGAAEDGELERPEKVSIIDAETGELKLVDLGTSYTFRSLGMNDDGLAVVLGTDGKLHLIDPEQAKVVKTIDVIDAWEESEEWQDPRPALAVNGDVAYVTDPATKTIHVVDLTGEKETLTAELPETPDELVVTEG
ncbi:hypothetical protein [Corynebacterium freneyi]|uniref:hypothetical protein n=1 Tax=Corynebacterium freneyi TaxID=134034 RepID=UPI001CCF430F|nr:hypothetical protein [Corynebacterium freneyi]UBI01435.1 hypothetical protein LA334_07800 [Corynebacterium freneyi]